MLNDADANHQAGDTTENKLEHRFYNRYYTLLNSLHDAVFVHDFEGNFLEVNSQAVDQLGYSREEILNMGPQDIDAPEFADKVEPRMQKIVKNGHLVFETAHITKDGHKIPIELSSTVVEYDGEPVIISVARDISKRKKAEKKLEESKNRLSLVIEGSGLGTWDWNVQTGDVIFNETWANMLGYELSEIEPSVDAWKKRVHPEDLPEVMEILNEHLEGKSDSYVSEHRMRTEKGDWVWIEDRGMVVERDEDGEPIRATGTHLDITERKHAQKALQAERKQLLEIFDSIDEIVYVVDPESDEVLFVNEYMREQFGSKSVGETCYEVFQGFDEPCDFCTNDIILENPGKPYIWQYHNPVLDIDLLITDRIIRWSDGRQVRFEIAIDITEQKKAQDELKKSKRELELYTSLLRHDLANDIQILINRLEYIEMLDDPIEIKTQCRSVRAASERMGKLLQIFTESKTGNSKGLVDTIETSIEQSEEANPHLQISLKLEDNRDQLNLYMGELAGLVFDNLLRNAAQHAGSDAQIEIEIREDENDIVIMLTDDGPGIPESIHPSLFQRKRSETGGMGLYLSKRVVEAYGGNFNLVDSTSEGATFEISFPKSLNDS